MKLTKTYPYFKSGMTFNWGALLGYAAVKSLGLKNPILIRRYYQLGVAANSRTMIGIDMGFTSL